MNRGARTARLRRGLLLVLLGDASVTTALVALAVVTRSRRVGPAYAEVARVAVASLLPGAIAVLLERRAHARTPPSRHRAAVTVLLLATGLAITTTGTLLALRPTGPVRASGPSAAAVDIGLLVGGDAIGVPYLALVAALHDGG